MKKSVLLWTIVVATVCAVVGVASWNRALAKEAKPAKAAAKAGKPAWSMNATIIEACSCPMFCQCFFSSKPAGGPEHAGHEGHGGKAEHFCRFNNAYRVNKGWFNDVKLDGVKFWVAGDLGDDFSDKEMDWALITFDAAMTGPQRDAVGFIL